MPGLLSAETARFFTKLSGDLVDFSNFGRRLTEKGIQGYSLEHIKKISFIWMATVCGGILAYLLEGEVDTKHSNSRLTIATGCLIGFLISHGYTMYPRIKARKGLLAEIGTLQSEIAQNIAAISTKEQSFEFSGQIWKNLALISAEKLSPASRTTLTLDLQEQKKRLFYLQKLIKADFKNNTHLASDPNLWQEYESKGVDSQNEVSYR